MPSHLTDGETEARKLDRSVQLSAALRRGAVRRARRGAHPEASLLAAHRRTGHHSPCSGGKLGGTGKSNKEQAFRKAAAAAASPAAWLPALPAAPSSACLPWQRFDKPGMTSSSPSCDLSPGNSHQETASSRPPQEDPTALSHSEPAVSQTSREEGRKTPLTFVCFNVHAVPSSQSPCRGRRAARPFSAYPPPSGHQLISKRLPASPATRLLWKERLIPTLKKKTLFLSLPEVYMGLKKKKHLLVVLHLAVLSVVLKHVSCNK